MPEHFSPSPDDQRPERTELESSNDEFLDDLSAKLEQPFSKTELAAQHQAKIEQANLKLDQIDAKEKDAGRAERWEQLPQETKNLLTTERMIFERIGKLILTKSGDSSLVELSEQAREAHNELGIAYNAYLDGGPTEKAFTEALHITLGQLEEIEHRLSTHP